MFFFLGERNYEVVFLITMFILIFKFNFEDFFLFVLKMI